MVTKARTMHKAKRPASKVIPKAKPVLSMAKRPVPKPSPASPAKIEALREKILAQLQGQFPGMVALTLGDALMSSGLARSEDPARVARQMVHRGYYPFPITKVGVKNRVLLIDLADYLARSAGAVGPLNQETPHE